MTKILRVYENITDFKDLQTGDGYLKVTFKDTDRQPEYMEAAGLFSMGPGGQHHKPIYYKLMTILFEDEASIIAEDYSKSNDGHSIRANEVLKLEVISR